MENQNYIFYLLILNTSIIGTLFHLSRGLLEISVIPYKMFYILAMLAAKEIINNHERDFIRIFH